jgi:hypothetical protein|tara:strand:+ start:422 stop:658 length:237 start_codon:yes stop_codon:yes gene_type:complete
MKLNKEELESVQKFNHERANLKLQMVNAEIEKFRVMGMLSTLERGFSIEQEKIAKKYGDDAIINPQTGEIQNTKTQNG